MSAELSSQVRVQLQKLAEKQAFAQSLDDFINTGIKVLTGSGQDYSEQTCPTALLLSMSHCVCNNLPFSTLASELPEEIREKFVAACNKYANQSPVLYIDQGLEDFQDVEWKIDISMGRELWDIIIKFQSGRKLRLLLNYQQLSVLVFKLGQVVAFVQNYQP